MRRAEFIFEEEEMAFGSFDLMYPQTIDKRTIRSSFEGGSDLKTYFNHYVKWLLEIGFTKEEINDQIVRYCNYQDEISP